MKNNQSVKNLKRNLAVTIISLVITVFSLVSITLCWYWVNVFNQTKAQGFNAGYMPNETIIIGSGDDLTETEISCENLIYARPMLNGTTISGWQVRSPIGLISAPNPVYTATISITTSNVASVLVTATGGAEVEFAIVDSNNVILACSQFTSSSGTQLQDNVFDAMSGIVTLYVWVDVNVSQATKDSQQNLTLSFSKAS